MKRRLLLGLCLVAAAGALAGCFHSEDHLSETNWRCNSAADCGAGWQCSQIDGFCTEAFHDINGVFDDRIVLAISGPIDSAPAVPGAEMIGRAVRDGFSTYFAHVNRTGGIHGRDLDLLVVDDGFDPEQTTGLLTPLLNGSDRKVFALASVLGTDPSLAAKTLAKEAKVLFFAPGSGLSEFEPLGQPDRYVFNFRPRYSEEVEQLIEYLTQRAEPRVGCGNVAVFTSHEPGDAESLSAVGRDGKRGASEVLRQLCSIAEREVVVASYPRNTVDVDGAVKSLLQWMADPARAATKENDGTIVASVVMLPAFDSGTALVQKLTDQIAAVHRADGAGGIDQKYGTFTETELAQLAHIELQFGVSSNVGLILAQAFGQLNQATKGYKTKIDGTTVTRLYGVGTIFATAVPSVTSDSTGVGTYREHLDRYKAELPEEQRDAVNPDPFSLEAYLVASLLGEALRRHGRDLTTESLIDSLEQLEGVKLGIGVTFGFSELSHQAMNKLFGQQFNAAGSFDQLGLLTGDS